MALGVALVVGLGAPAQAQSPWDQIFPVGNGCYERSYTAAHLDRHPQQRVTGMRVRAAPDMPADPWPAVAVRVALRGSGGGQAEAVAYCENEGGSTLYCVMEGDAGAFTIEPARGGAILVKVSRDGMGFETNRAFVTLEARQGDDRSFLLQPAQGCR